MLGTNVYILSECLPENPAPAELEVKKKTFMDKFLEGLCRGDFIYFFFFIFLVLER